MGFLYSFNGGKVLVFLQQVTKAASKLLLIKKAHPYTARCGLYRDELKMLVFKGDKLNYK
jgi:hypothetical protein